MKDIEGATSGNRECDKIDKLEQQQDVQHQNK